MNRPAALAIPTPGAGTGVAGYRLALILVTSLFFMWGLSYGLLDVLNKHFQETLHVTRAQSGLLQMAYFGAYFLLAMPAAALMNRRGYKAGILVGLGLFGLGALLFIPATRAASFAYFLFALFVIASGLACLETAANPYVTSLGPVEGGPRRLNLSQSFNGLGQFVGPLIGGALFFSGAGSGSAHGSVQATYVVIAGIVTLVALAIWRTPMPDLREHERLMAPEGEARLLGQRHFTRGVIAQFFYVAAQVGVGAFFINFVTEHGSGVSSRGGAFLLSVGMLCFFVGRFAGTALMMRVAPQRLLGTYAVISAALTLVVVAALPRLSTYALVALFFFMSIMFPTIFALGVRNLGANTRRGSSFLIMSIVGGAIAPYVMGSIADRSSTAIAFLVPAACFVVVAWYGFRGHRAAFRHASTEL